MNRKNNYKNRDLEGGFMEVYKNLAGNIGVCEYEFGDKNIRVKLHTRQTYIYDYKYTGESHVEQMKVLACKGVGLNDYINENVNDQYAYALD